MFKKLSVAFAALLLAFAVSAATIDLAPINVPAGADSTDTQAALAAYFAGEVPESPTLAQLTEAMRQRNIKWLKELVKDYRKAQAAISAPGLN